MYPNEELVDITQRFFKELILAESGQSDCVSFFRTSLKNQSFITPGKAFQVFIIGGTNAQTALVSSDLKIIESKTIDLPVFSEEEVLLDFVASNLYPDITKIALNFAFPIKSIDRDGKLDAQLVRATKEHFFEGLFGKNIGELLEDFIQGEYGRKVDIILANDIVCLLLANQSKDTQTAAAIVGTGYNTGVITDNGMMVNLESGNFNKFIPSNSGKIIDKESSNPGEQLFEKEISGAYLYKHYNLLNDNGAKISSGKEMDELAASGDEIALNLIQRSASLLATQIAAIYIYLGEEKTTFNMEGSVFWKSYRYQEFVYDTLKLLGIPKSEIKFVGVKDSFDGVVRLAVGG